MDEKASPPEMLLAPSTGSCAALRFSSAESFPSLDEHLVQPETREEMVRGRRVVAAPADPAHGDPHCELNYVVRAHIAPGYVGSIDLLTHCSPSSDFATDLCIRKKGIDPHTGTRYLEELAFEVVHTQSLQDITERAEDLSTRGVRRVLALFVKTREVKEWVASPGYWQRLDPDSTISDPCLLRPLRVQALFDPLEADNEVQRALLKKNNPVLEGIIREAYLEGRKAGLLEGRKAGLLEGIKAGIQEVLIEQFEMRLGRALVEIERRLLSDETERLGRKHISALLFDSSPPALEAWFANPTTRC